MFGKVFSVGAFLVCVGGASGCSDPVVKAKCAEPFVTGDGRLAPAQARLGEVFAVRTIPDEQGRFCAQPFAYLDLGALQVSADPLGDWHRSVSAKWSLDGSLGYGDDFATAVNLSFSDSLTLDLEDGEVSRIRNYAGALNSLEQPLIEEVEDRFLDSPFRNDVVFLVTDTVVSSRVYSLLYEGNSKTTGSITVLDAGAEVEVEWECKAVSKLSSETALPRVFSGAFFEYDFDDSRKFRAGLGQRAERPSLATLFFESCDF